MATIQDFSGERERLNEIVMKYAGLGVKRFYSLDAQAYRAGALPEKTKELLGLVASLVLRCDDCVKYHLIQCAGLGVTDAEIEESLNIGLIVGGSIVIPHLRRAFEAWDQLNLGRSSAPLLKANAANTATPQESRAALSFSASNALFGKILEEIQEIVETPLVRREKLRIAAQALARECPHYNWVGFYLADDDKKELLLGPFVGEPTEHTRIPFGRGICGRVADTRETLLVPDVTKEKNYLACSIKVKSEIVIPIISKGCFVAELDIDSHSPSAFSNEDRLFLEEVCRILAGEF